MMEVNIAKFIIVFDISLDNSYKKIVIRLQQSANYNIL